MRNAPSVVFPVGRCFFYAGLLAALGGLGLLVLLLWWWSWLGTPGEAPFLVRLADAVGLLLWVVWAGFARWRWLRSPVGQLQWDALGAPVGGTSRAGLWRWRVDAYTDAMALRQVERVLDLQSHLLLRLHPADGAPRWVWLERAPDPGRWNDLRRALVGTS